MDGWLGIPQGFQSRSGESMLATVPGSPGSRELPWMPSNRPRSLRSKKHVSVQVLASRQSRDRPRSPRLARDPCLNPRAKVPVEFVVLIVPRGHEQFVGDGTCQRLDHDKRVTLTPLPLPLPLPRSLPNPFHGVEPCEVVACFFILFQACIQAFKQGDMPSMSALLPRLGLSEGVHVPIESSPTIASLSVQ